MLEILDYYMNLIYRIEIIEDLEEGGYALYCAELPGCITCAETISQGFIMIEDAKNTGLKNAWKKVYLSLYLSSKQQNRKRI